MLWLFPSLHTVWSILCAAIQNFFENFNKKHVFSAKLQQISNNKLFFDLKLFVMVISFTTNSLKYFACGNQKKIWKISNQNIIWLFPCLNTVWMREFNFFWKISIKKTCFLLQNYSKYQTISFLSPKIICNGYILHYIQFEVFCVRESKIFLENFNKKHGFFCKTSADIKQ